MPKPVIKHEPDLEDPEGNDVVFSFSNGVSQQDEWQGGLLCIRLNPDGTQTIKIYRQSEGVSIDAPQASLAPGIPIEAFLVSASGGVYVVFNDSVADFLDYTLLHPVIFTLLEKAVAATGQVLLWVEDVDGEAEYLARLAGRNGIPEFEVLQQALDRGHLRPRRNFRLRQLESRMYQPRVSPKVIGGNIRKVREALGLSVAELANYARLDEAHIQAFENGSEIVFAEELVQIAKALGVDDPEILLDPDLPDFTAFK